ncbi:ABC transporter substrate-binding protein [Halorubrum laminariae]|uniref:ABC transporter substrate-binding protein n=1 Tax=Halorubrum laminariae TaxID=1433523 RepID=A0ABD6C558_9EURY|nr:ABC transporter substrate-binding protein [Halorubrum laminariae]
MSDDAREPALTRRRLIVTGSAAAATGVAGCAGDIIGGSAGGAADASDPTADSAREDTGGGDDASAVDDENDTLDAWTASLAPAGDVTFESVPERIAAYDLLSADLAVAYGHADAITSLGFDTAVGGETLSAYYERLDGVDPDWEGLTQLNTGETGVNVDAELLYELDSDLHLIDPALVTSFEGWTREEVEAIGETVGPWIGNNYSRRHGEPPAAWDDEYAYYTVWEVAARVSTVFRAEARYEALAAVYENLLATIEADLPPAEDRPTVAMALLIDGTFYPTAANAPGYATAHVRPFGVEDAFAGEAVSFETTYDYEAMLAFDPDVFLHPYGLASHYSVPDVREMLADHPVGSEITAVDGGRVYASGVPMQGPIVTLFQTEMTAKQLFPDRFGEWPDYAGGPYPEIPEGERLFDRNRVAEVVRGDV